MSRSKITFTIPHLSPGWEFPLLFCIFFLPVILNGAPLPAGIFDNSAYQSQIILQSLLIFFLTRHLALNSSAPSELKKRAETTEIRWNETAIAFSGLIAVFALQNGLIFIARALGYTGQAEASTVLLTKNIMLPGALVLSIAVGWSEEFFFRAYGYLRLKESGLSEGAAFVTVNVLFALCHLYGGLWSLVSALISGFLLSILFKRGYSLYSLGTAHGLYNFTMILGSRYLQTAEGV